MFPGICYIGRRWWSREGTTQQGKGTLGYHRYHNYLQQCSLPNARITEDLKTEIRVPWRAEGRLS
jgi:hypothetical protein